MAGATGKAASYPMVAKDTLVDEVIDLVSTAMLL